MLVRLVKKKVNFKTKDGKEKSAYNFYLETENKNWVPIQPVKFDEKNSSYQNLSLLADLVKD